MSFLALLPSLIQAGISLAGLFKKKPSQPSQAPPASLSPEEKARMLDAIRRKIGTNVNTSIGSLDSSLASRGLARGGLMPTLESNIVAGGNTDYANAVTDVEQNNQAMLERWRKLQYGQQMGQYNSDLGHYYDSMGAAGQNLGNAASDLTDYFGKPKKNATPWRTYV